MEAELKSKLSDLENNLKLWSAVEVTDPAVTRHVNQRGGFTAICAQHQLKTATGLWGPYGDKWGVRKCVWGSVSNNGEVLEITLDAEFFYPAGDHEASFPLAADIAYRAGNDSRKKLLTDLTTKALSKLGFNADVFMGKYDDNKYVEEMKKKFGNGGERVPYPSGDPPPARTQPPVSEELGI